MLNQERKLPDKPGYWWGSIGNRPYKPLEVVKWGSELGVFYLRMTYSLSNANWGHYVGPIGSPTCPPDPEALLEKVAEVGLYHGGSAVPWTVEEVIAEARREMEEQCKYK